MRKIWFAITAGMLLIPVIGQADAITFGGSKGDLSASVTFANVGGQLQVTLTNTSMADALVPSDILTAVFWNWNYSGTLTPVSATVATGSNVYYGTYPSGGNVGGEWAYRSNLAGAPGGATFGISSSGLDGTFGQPNFNGPDLTAPTAINGLSWGITSQGDVAATGNNGVTKDPLIHYSVVFLFSGIDGLFDPSLVSFTDVSFQYGTALSEPNVPVPEPGTMMLLGAGLVGLASFGRKKFRK